MSDEFGEEQNNQVVIVTEDMSAYVSRSSVPD